MDADKKIKIGITQGDYNGVGYEVMLKALADNRILELCTPVVYGSAKIAAFYRKACALPEMKLNQVPDANAAQDEKYNIVNVTGEDARIDPGVPTPDAAAGAVAALRQGVDDLRQGRIDALVTCPINKASIHGDDFPYPGHTEFLEAELCDGDGDKAMMVLFKDALRVALVTIHEPLDAVADKVTREAVEDAIYDFDRSLREDFGLHAPRIAVLSLDPHAGDKGVIGSRDAQVVAPAVEQARKDQIQAFGPYPSDGLFGSGNYAKFDGILAMYHDQGLTPFKLLAQNEGVNFTAGLKAVRTSPDHGTAYDIAGQGKADESSMRNAIYAAIDIVRNRAAHAEATANPLGK